LRLVLGGLVSRHLPAPTEKGAEFSEKKIGLCDS